MKAVDTYMQSGKGRHKAGYEILLSREDNSFRAGFGRDLYALPLSQWKMFPGQFTGHPFEDGIEA